MGSPDNRRKADNSCRALCAGRSMFELLRDKQLVRSRALLEKAARGKIALRGVLSPARERIDLERRRRRYESESCLSRSSKGASSERHERLDLVVLGSILGGVARYFLSGVVARRVGETFPWGTLFGQCQRRFPDRDLRCDWLETTRRCLPRQIHGCSP